MPMKINHVALWCDDLEAMKTFYECFFQAQSNDRYHNKDKGFSSYFLSFSSGARLEIMHNKHSGHPHRETGNANIGYAHLACSVGSEDEVRRLTSKLARDGYNCIDGPRRTGDGYYESVVLDPEGNRIEITI